MTAALVGLGLVAAAAGALAVYTTARGEAPARASPYVQPVESRSSATGAPLLMLIPGESANPLRVYLSEILLAEGINAFEVRSSAELDWSALDRYPLIVVGDGVVNPVHADLLHRYVRDGGRAVIMRPAGPLAAMCGVVPLGGGPEGGYLLPNPAVDYGLPAEGLQFHGEAELYGLSGATPLAWLSNDGQMPLAHPAVVRHRVGKGHVVVWAFDLARSVALTRQGNPAWANQERDGLNGLRAQEAFVGWIDLDRIAIPQADVQMRLLSQLIAELLGDLLPLPRLWYFPDGADSVLIATGDAHGSMAAAVEQVLSRVERYGGRMTVYYAPSSRGDARRAARRLRSWLSDLPAFGILLRREDGPPTPASVKRWRQSGHEFGVHPYVEGGVETGWTRCWRDFTGLGYGPVPPTVRTHAVLWQGWVESARVQASVGIRLNADYYHVGGAFRKTDGTWVHGHLTGSGLPMRFIDEQGRLLNIYQLNTQLVDEHLMKMPWGPQFAALGAEQALGVSRSVLASGAAGGYSAFCVQFHIDPFGMGAEWHDPAGRWLDGTLEEATRRGFPVWSAERLLRFISVRNAAVFDQLRWDPAGGRLSFTLDAPAHEAERLTVALPGRAAGRALNRVMVDGAAAALRRRDISGTGWHCFSLAAGRRSVVAVYE